MRGGGGRRSKAWVGTVPAEWTGKITSTRLVRWFVYWLIHALVYSCIRSHRIFGWMHGAGGNVEATACDEGFTSA